MSEPTPPNDDQVEPETEDRLGSFEVLMRKLTVDPKLRNAGMSIWMLDQEPDWDKLLERWDRASRVVPRMRQRIVDPALGLGTPTWVNDPNFDLEFHVRRVRAPAPGTLRQLLDLARPILMLPVDPARPPWEVILVEGLEGGKAALIQKGDHTSVDGQGGMELMMVICDFEREAADVEMPPLPDAAASTPNELLRAELADRVRDAPRSAVQGVQGAGALAGKIVRNPRRSASGTVNYMASIARMAGSLRIPRSPLLEQRSMSHQYDVLEVSVADLRKAGKSIGGSLNDAFLAGLSGGVRIYHERHDTAIETMPFGFAVSTRREDDPLLSNKFTDVMIPAPVGITDPAERMAKLRELVLDARAEPALTAFDSVAPVVSMLPAKALASAFGGSGGDVNASNIAGPPIPLFMAGAEVEKLYGFGPLLGCAMIAGLISVMGTCCIGINYDPASFPDGDELMDCLREGFEEVLALGGEHSGIVIATRPEA